MKRTFAGAANNAKYPKGCFLITGKFYYNTVKAGKANKAASPVCVTTVAAAPKKKLVLAGKGKASCAGKGAAVKDQNGCKSAAKAMKRTFAGAANNAKYPKGCFLITGKFYYNTVKAGKANKAASPVC